VIKDGILLEQFFLHSIMNYQNMFNVFNTN